MIAIHKNTLASKYFYSLYQKSENVILAVSSTFFTWNNYRFCKCPKNRKGAIVSPKEAIKEEVLPDEKERGNMILTEMTIRLLRGLV